MTNKKDLPPETETILNDAKNRTRFHDWDDPDWSILDDRRGELPEFPLDCLSGLVREWVEHAADGAGVTVAHVAMPAIGIASSLVGMARSVKASRSWVSPMTCWTAIVGASGTGKTPGIDAIKRALAEVARNNRSKIADLQRKHEEKAGAAKAARAQWDKEVKDALAAKKTPPPLPPDAMDIGKFVAPQLFVSNATIERLSELLQARPQGMLQLMDELAALFMNMSRYSGGQDNEFWLEAWNGGAYNVQRVNRPPLSIDYLLVGLVGGVQPDKLVASFEGSNDGMYARFLFSWPPTPAYRPLSDETNEFNPDIVNAMGRLERLAEFDDGNLVKSSIELSPEARAKFEGLRQWAYQEREALDGKEQEWMAKVPAHVLRLAGTLCLLAWASRQSPTPPATIAPEYMAAAIQLVQDYFWPHARAALRQIGMSERHVNARRVLRWIKTHREPGQDISIKDVRREALGQSLDATQTISLLEAMTRSGWMREKKAEIGPKGGRPARRWEANPALYNARPEQSGEQTEQSSQQRRQQGGRGVPAVSAVSAPHGKWSPRSNGGSTPSDQRSAAKQHVSSPSRVKNFPTPLSKARYLESPGDRACGAETAGSAETPPRLICDHCRKPGAEPPGPSTATLSTCTPDASTHGPINKIASLSSRPRTSEPAEVSPPGSCNSMTPTTAIEQ
jgi:Protein of unknown function (DUF3987)